MVLDSLKSDRMIGIIQPKNNNNELFLMGCLGKITSYIETPDYRIVLNIEGVCRFILDEHYLNPKGYYSAKINTKDFIEDLNNSEPQIDRNNLIKKYSNFFKMKKLEIDKNLLSETSNLQLLSTLAMLAPFNKIDKQAILESPNILNRIETINSILDLNTFQVVNNNSNKLHLCKLLPEYINSDRKIGYCLSFLQQVVYFGRGVICGREQRLLWEKSHSLP